MTQDTEAMEPDADDYKVKDAFNHMVEAEKVKANPALLAKVHAHAQAHAKAIEGIQASMPAAAPEGPMKPKSTKEIRAIHTKFAMAKKGR